LSSHFYEKGYLHFAANEMFKIDHGLINCIISGVFRHVQHVRPNRGPTKRDPAKGAVIFCMPEKWATPEWKGEWWAKKGRQFFPGKIGSAAPVEGHTFFSEQGPAEIKSGPVRQHLSHFSVEVIN